MVQHGVEASSANPPGDGVGYPEQRLGAAGEDEYGQRFKPREFIIMIETTLQSKRVREESSRQMASLRASRYPEDQFWLDERGFLFITDH